MNSKHSLFIVVTILVCVGGIIWILNIENIIIGPWSSIFGAISTVLGIVLALLQIVLQPSTELPKLPMASVMHQQIYCRQTENFKRNISRYKGELVVKMSRKCCGITVHLCYGFCTVQLKTDVATSVVEREINGRIMYMAYFHSLKPGNYTVHTNSGQYVAKVTIYARQVAEVDWRQAR